LSHIDAQSIKLTNLLDQLLDSSRIQVGRLVLERKPTDIIRLVRECVEQQQAKTNMHTISIEAEQDIEINVDALRFEQVITDLLDNAIKYSPDGGSIDVEITCRAEDWLHITITDQGIGVAPDHRDKLFERFYQAHQNGYGGGMGLGLYISKEIVELHGGHIRAEFPDEGGTRFIVELPIHP